MSAKNVEEWRPVVGWEGLYEVSSLGRVRSLPRVVTGRDGVVQRVPGRIRKAPVLRNGYPHVSLCSRPEGRLKVAAVHRLVAAAFIGPRPDGCETRHLDGDKTNNVLSNLAYGTVAENQADRVLHGTSNRGTRCGSAKLTEDDVREIRARAASETRAALASAFGVTSSCIDNVVRRTTWRWLS